MSTPDTSGTLAQAQAAAAATAGPASSPDDTEQLHATGSWASLTRALGRDLQGGMYRAEQARRRIARMR